MSTMGSRDSVPKFLQDSAPGSAATPETVQQAWQLVLQHILALTDASGGVIALLEQENFVCKAAAGEAPPVLVLHDPTERLVADCIHTNQTIISDDVRHDSRIDPAIAKLLNIGSLVILPLHAYSKVEGVIALSSATPSAFGEVAVETMRALTAAIELMVFSASEEPDALSDAESEPLAGPEVSSGALASAFARAIADSDVGGAIRQGAGESTDLEVPAADLFAAAGMFRADVPGSSDEEPESLHLPSLSDFDTESELPSDNGEENHPDLSPVAPGQVVVTTPVPQPEVTAAPAEIIHRVAKNRAAAISTPPPSQRAPQLGSSSRHWLVALIAVLVVVFGSVSVWLLRQSHSSRTVAPQQFEQSLTSNIASPPASAGQSSTVVTPVLERTSSPDSPAATTAPMSKPDLSPTVPQSNERPPKPIILPSTRIRTSRADEAVTAPPVPPPSASRTATTLKSLLSANSALPILSGRVDATFVTLPVPRDSQSVFSAARLITQNLPPYPDAARNSNRQGSVVLHATVLADGRTSQVSVVAGDPLLTPAAVSSVQTWVYQPATIDGHPVESTVQVTVNFHLNP